MIVWETCKYVGMQAAICLFYPRWDKNLAQKMWEKQQYWLVQEGQEPGSVRKKL